jgi:serine/threonine-protein kinase RsbW
VSPTNSATVRVADGPFVAPVLSRVVGMLAARAQCPVDRLDDALLVTDAIAAHAPEHSRNGHVVVELQTGPDGLQLDVLGLRDGGGDGLLAAAELPGVGNVLERIADDVRSENDHLVVRVSFGA